MDRLRQLAVALEIGPELPDALHEWLEGAVVARLVGDAATLDEALGIERPVDPRTDAALREMRDNEIRRIAEQLEGTATERAGELASMVRCWWTKPDPRLRSLMGLGMAVPKDARQLRRIICRTYW